MRVYACGKLEFGVGFGFFCCLTWDFMFFLVLFSGLGLLSLVVSDLGFCGVGWLVGWVCNVV